MCNDGGVVRHADEVHHEGEHRAGKHPVRGTLTTSRDYHVAVQEPHAYRGAKHEDDGCEEHHDVQ